MVQFVVLAYLFSYGAFPDSRRSQETDADRLKKKQKVNQSINQSFSTYGSRVWHENPNSRALSLTHQQASGELVFLYNSVDVLNDACVWNPADIKILFIDIFIQKKGFHSKVDEQMINFRLLGNKQSDEQEYIPKILARAFL